MRNFRYVVAGAVLAIGFSATAIATGVAVYVGFFEPQRGGGVITGSIR
jgi:hypothetical protein